MAAAGRGSHLRSQAGAARAGRAALSGLPQPPSGRHGDGPPTWLGVYPGGGAAARGARPHALPTSTTVRERKAAGPPRSPLQQEEGGWAMG